MGHSTGIDSVSWTMGDKGVDDHEQTFMGQQMWKEIWAYLQESEASLFVFHAPAHKVPTTPDDHKVDASAKSTL